MEYQIEMLSKATKDQRMRLVLNDKYICEFDYDSYHDALFLKQENDVNCCRESYCADVIAYDYSSFSTHIGKLYINYDKDLSPQWSMSIVLFNDAELPTSGINVVKIAVKPARVNVADFMKHIKYKPLHSVKEPYDSCGLTICQFKEHDNYYPTIEFGMDGYVYYEIVDENGYNEGDVLPLDSDRRKDVLAHTQLTEDRVLKIAEHINNSLDNLYSDKKQS